MPALDEPSYQFIYQSSTRRIRRINLRGARQVDGAAFEDAPPAG